MLSGWLIIECAVALRTQSKVSTASRTDGLFIFVVGWNWRAQLKWGLKSSLSRCYQLCRRRYTSYYIVFASALCTQVDGGITPGVRGGRCTVSPRLQRCRWTSELLPPPSPPRGVRDATSINIAPAQARSSSGEGDLAGPEVRRGGDRLGCTVWKQSAICLAAPSEKKSC